MGRRQRAQERAKQEYEASYGKPPSPSPPPSAWTRTVLPIVVIALGIGLSLAGTLLLSSVLANRPETLPASYQPSLLPVIGADWVP